MKCSHCQKDAELVMSDNITWYPTCKRTKCFRKTTRKFDHVNDEELLIIATVEKWLEVLKDTSHNE